MKITMLTMSKLLFSNYMTRLLIIGLVLLSTIDAALALEMPTDEVVVVPTGEERSLGPDDFRPQDRHGSAFNEIWTYSLLLDSGMQATFSISYANLGSVMGAVSGAEFSISGFEGQSYRAPKEYDADDLIYQAATGKLQVHPEIYVEGVLPQRHSIRFGAKKGELRYDVALTLTDIARGLTWGNGVFKLGNEKLGMFIHIPYARVNGTVTIGGVTKQVSGTAYMDHTFQTEFAPKIVRESYRYVQHTGSMEVGYFVTPHARYNERVVGIGAVKERGRFRLRKPEKIHVVSQRPALGADVANQLLIQYEGGGQTILNRDRDAQRFSVLDQLSGLQRAVVKRYIGGEAAVFRGRGVTNQRSRFAYDFMVIK